MSFFSSSKSILAASLLSVAGSFVVSGCDLEGFGTGTVRPDRDWDHSVCSVGRSDYDDRCIDRRRADRNACGFDRDGRGGRGGRDHRRVCTSRYDYYGRLVEQCYEINECHGGNRFSANMMENAPVQMLNAKQVLQTLNADSIAYDYLMKPEGVQLVLNALSAAVDGDTTALLNLGFQEQDLKALGQLNLAGMDEHSFEVLAGKLDSSPVLAKGIVARFILTAQKLQQADSAQPE